jgi:alpha-L-fucosidase 2
MERRKGRQSRNQVSLGGNLRLRLPNEMKLKNGRALKAALGANSNPFYQIEEIAAPLISDKAILLVPELKKTLLYDLKTIKGKTYTLMID